MKVIEVMGRVDRRGELILDRPLGLANCDRVRVLVLFPDDVVISPPQNISQEDSEETEEEEEELPNPLADLWERIEEEV